MNENRTERSHGLIFPVSEDWLAVIAGVVLVALVYLGILTRVPW